MTLQRWARERPKATALVFGGKNISFRDLNRSVNRVANGLGKLGIREGDRVAIMLPNIPEFVYTFYACLKLGAVAVPFNTMYRSREILHILRDSGARVLVCLTNAVQLVNEIRGELPGLEYVLTTGERTLTFAHPDSTMFLQAVVGRDVFSSLDDAYRRTGGALVDGLKKLGVDGAVYRHMGAVRVGEKKIAGFVVSEIEDLFVVNALCFVDRFDANVFLTAIWVPPEVKDKVVEPTTSVAEECGRRPSPEEFRAAMCTSLESHGGMRLEEGSMTREERFGYEKQRMLVMPKVRARSQRSPFFERIRKLFGRS
jgi:long-chain acyl-CoA synthetase